MSNPPRSRRMPADTPAAPSEEAAESKVAPPVVPSGSTIEELYGPAMRITERSAALVYLEELAVLLAQEHRMGAQEALTLARSNLGYYAGNFDHETRLRVEELFDAPHPYLGSARDGPLDVDTIFAIGLKLGRGGRLDDAPASQAPGQKSH